VLVWFLVALPVAMAPFFCVNVYAAGNLLINGGFEDPPNAPPGGFVTYFGGESIPGWLVGGESIDVHNTEHTQAHSGNQSLDLSGVNLPGSIQQEVGVTMGKKYLLDVWYCAHVYHPYDGNAFAEIRWSDSLVDTLSLPPSVDNQSMNWTNAQYLLTASSALESLAFISLSPNGGIIVDDLSLTLVPEPSTCVLPLLTALFASGLSVRNWRNDRCQQC
jgi:hypothetical protein